jgi:hypothetical protein
VNNTRRGRAPAADQVRRIAKRTTQGTTKQKPSPLK